MVEVDAEKIELGVFNIEDVEIYVDKNKDLLAAYRFDGEGRLQDTQLEYVTECDST